MIGTITLRRLGASSRAQGFTLLEVLVALTILGLGIVTLLQIFSLGLRLESRSSVSTETMTLGARIMDELVAGVRLRDGSESGRIDGAARWQAQIQPLRDKDAGLTLSSPWEIKEITLELFVSEGGRERRVEFKTLRLARKDNS